ncbi:glycosyltransferase family 39 protein [Nonomuraea sp. NPDC050556]|uniref:glycosyltransferase family 39 protein n=1 Tax=Nonomuraea sp. NPDC050556 TaxID=3364369 RepID=UPI0037A2D8F1
MAWRPLSVIVVVLVLVLLVVSPMYGYHRDELYFRLLADHPAWGYVDQPPLTPMVARAAIALFGDTLTAIRVPAALMAAAFTVLVTMICRELGGGRYAQILAAAGTATGVFTLIAGHVLLTLSADLPLWAAAILFVLRALLRGDGRWWLAAGAVIGLATYNKHLIALLVIGLAAGLLAAGPRAVLRSPWLWAGAALAVALAVPNLVYQVTHDWPQLKMAAALSENKGGEFRILFVPMQLVLFGPVVAVIAWFGFLRMWRDRRVRALAVAYPVAAALTLISGGRFDYTAGLLAMLFAAGCVSVAESWQPRTAAVALGINGVIGALVALPLLPVQAVAATPIPQMNEVVRESIGWPSFAERVSAVLKKAPQGSIVLTGSYGEAGALDLAGLPGVYSGQNQLFEYGPPPETATSAVAVKLPKAGLERFFTSCTEMARTDNGLDVDNEFQDLPIFVCTGLKGSWRQMWPHFQHYD